MKKTVSVIAMLLALVLILSACDKDSSGSSAGDTEKPKTIEGTWTVTELKPISGTSEYMLGFIQEANDSIVSGTQSEIYTFTAGKLTVKHIEKKEGVDDPVINESSQNYAINGNNLTLTREDGTEIDRMTFALNGDTLEIVIPEQYSAVLSRNK